MNWSNYSTTLHSDRSTYIAMHSVFCSKEAYQHDVERFTARHNLELTDESAVMPNLY